MPFRRGEKVEDDYYVRGIAYTGMQTFTAAIADLQKARAIASGAKADYILGIVASRKNDVEATMDYLNKTKGSPTYSSDSVLAKQVDDALNKLNSAIKSQFSSRSQSY